MADTDLIELKNSNALYKYPVDAEQLMHNFRVLAAANGGTAIQNVIESSGQTYSTLIENQLAMAIAQYVMSGTIFDEVGNSDAYILNGRNGMELPYHYTEGMVVTFKTDHTNMGASTLQLGNLEPKAIHVNGNDIIAGYMPINTFVSFVYTKEVSAEGDVTYAWCPVETSSSGGGSGSGSGGSDSDTVSNYPLIAIRKLLTSAGLAYSSSDDALLANAIAQYAHGILYNCEYEAGTYKLSTTESHIAPKHLFPGLVVMFRASDTNTTDYTLLKFASLQAVPLLDENGRELASGAIYPNQLIIAVYHSGAFRIISTYIPSIKLSDGHILNGLSNDHTLENDSETVAVSEHAVREYVDSKMKGSMANTIIDGYTDDQNKPAAVRLVGSHQIELIAGEQSFVSETPNDPSQIITSCVDAIHVLKNNCLVDLNPTSYWETDKTGFAIDDLLRTVIGDSGARAISLDYDEDGEEQYKTTPPAPEWFGFLGFTKLPAALKIKFTDADHTPNRVLVQVNFANTESGTWYDLVTVTQDGSSYETNTEYGNLVTMEQDADGYYRLALPNYYDVGLLSSGASPDMRDPLPFPDTPSLPFSMRVVFTETTNLQQVPTDVLNQDSYNPNTDTTSPQTNVQVIDAQFGHIVDSPIFSFTYPNTDAGEVVVPKYYSQYIYNAGDLTEDPPVYPTSELDGLSAGDHVIYIEQGEDTLKIIHSSLVFKQSERPSATEEEEGGVWFETTSSYPATYVCKPIDDTNYDWVRSNVMLIAKAEVTVAWDGDPGTITSVTPMAYGTSITRSYLAQPNMDETIEHNFGQTVAVSFDLECIESDIGYNVGDRIEVLPFYYHRYSVTPSTVTKNVYGPEQPAPDPEDPPVRPVIGTVDVTEYTSTDTVIALFASSNEQYARVRLTNFELLRKDSNQTAQITSNKWRLTVQITKG